MSKQHSNKYKKINGDSHVRLLRAWLQTAQICDERTEEIISSVFRTLKSGIAGKISASCGNTGGLLSHDEDLYECYKRLMLKYSELAKRYMETKHCITTAQTAAILNGIYSVVVSRLILSDENDKNCVPSYPNNTTLPINPIFLEKKEILSECVKTFSKNFDITEKEFRDAHQYSFLREIKEAIVNGADYNDTLYMLNNFADKLRELCMPSFYQYFAQITRFAAISLNDWDSRKSLSWHVEMLRQERQILDDIVSAQLPVLANLLQSPMVSDNEKNVIFAFNYALNEANEHFLSDLDELSAFFRLENTKPYECRPDSYETFENELSDMILAEKLLSVQAFDEWHTNFSLKYTAFLNTAEEEACELIRQGLMAVSPNTYKYRFNRVIYETQLMAEDMCAAFKSMNNYFEENRAALEGCAKPDTDIICGVNETIAIKLEAITEAKEFFLAEVRKSLSDFAPEPLTDSSECEGKARAGMCRLAVRLCALNKDDNGLYVLKKNLTECVDGILAEHNEKASRGIAKYDDVIRKMINKFKREHLLYETSTLEEIMNYSVSRLRESNDEAVHGYVRLIDAEVSELIKVLQKNGIELIKPKPHDMFNGKEHEVLMAEQNPEFKKGEIIKLMNNGYRQGETVLMRANVIAAK